MRPQQRKPGKIKERQPAKFADIKGRLDLAADSAGPAGSCTRTARPGIGSKLMGLHKDVDRMKVPDQIGSGDVGVLQSSVRLDLFGKRGEIEGRYDANEVEKGAAGW
jgi:hypothetical protein